jgi:electron transfer flavoprotein beta subunit
MSYQIIVCGGLAPDPLQTLEPVAGPAGAALKNEMMLPHVFDPWAAHALYEAAHLAKLQPGSSVKVVTIAPKAKLQQVMMTVAQKLAFELVPVDAPAGGFTDAAEVAEILATTIAALPGLDRSQLLLFGGWESATRGAGTVIGMVAAKLGIEDCFLAVDELSVADGALKVKERVEGGLHQVSSCAGAPAAFGWATGNLPEPANHPQTGMQNMRAMMPALQRARSVALKGAGYAVSDAHLPAQQRQTRIVKDQPAAEIAREIAAWIQG